MISRQLATALLVVLASSAVHIEQLRAQSDTARAQQKDTKRPLLGPHRFIPNPATEDPFPRTYVRNSLGIGQALDLEIVPEFVIGTDTLGGLRGDLIFALLDFEYSQRIKDWMGFWVTAKVRGRLGDNVGSLVTEGVTLTTGFEIGWLLKFLETDRIAMSATAQVVKSDLTGINLFEFLQGVVDSQPVPLVREVPVIYAGGGLRFAWAVNTWLGVTANGTVLYGEPPDRLQSGSAFAKLAAGASLDFASLIHVPIGLGLALNWDSDDPDGQSSASSQGALVRIAYTGRDDFVIALDLAVLHTTLFSGTTVDITTTNVSMRYYF